MPSIYANIICSEEDYKMHLPRCIDSIVGQVDNIKIQVTRPSTSKFNPDGGGMWGTRCRNADQKIGIEDMVWREDFSMARNRCLRRSEHADWIFVIDADEVLETKKNLHELAEVDDCDCYLFPRISSHYKPMSNINVSEQVFITRMIRNTEKFAPLWTGIVHEYLKIPHEYAIESVDPKDFLLRHYGYEIPDQVSDKVRRNLKLLHRGLDKEPENEQYVLHIGRAYKLIGDLSKSDYYFNLLDSIQRRKK